MVESYGAWSESEDGNGMVVTFDDPTVYYIEMPGLEAENLFTVTRTSSREITFAKTDKQGTLYTYRLKKQP